MDTKRLILFVIFSFSVLMLWDSWQKHNVPEPVAATAEQQDASIPQAIKSDLPVATSQADLPQTGGFKLEKGQRIRIETDLYQGEIDSIGGDLRKLALLEHRADDNVNDFVLLDDEASPLLYVAQTGLIGNELPTHRSVFTSVSDSYKMAGGTDKLEVRLSWTNDAGLQVDKIYTFNRGSYAIGVTYQVVNNTAAAVSPSVYYQILHDSQSNQGSFMMPTFTPTWPRATSPRIPKMAGWLWCNITSWVPGFRKKASHASSIPNNFLAISTLLVASALWVK
jgi:YidC/Oxa1 family membrane protein insertase